MLWCLENVRDNIRTRQGRRVFFLAEGDTLTSSARDYLTEERIPIVPAAQAKITQYRGLDGCYYEEKPEHMTQLTGEVLVPKTHPRIRFWKAGFSCWRWRNRSCRPNAASCWILSGRF